MFTCVYYYTVDGPIIFSKFLFFFPAPPPHPNPRAHTFAHNLKRANRRKRFEEYSTSATTSPRTRRRLGRHAARISLDRDRGGSERCGGAAGEIRRGEGRAVLAGLRDGPAGLRRRPNTSDGSERSHSCRRRFQFSTNARHVLYNINFQITSK